MYALCYLNALKAYVWTLKHKLKYVKQKRGQNKMTIPEFYAKLKELDPKLAEEYTKQSY